MKNLTNSSLVDIPTVADDLISSLHFNPDNDLLHTGSWDGLLNIYDVRKSVANYNISNKVSLDDCLYGSFNTGCSVLDSCWDPHNKSLLYTGNINGMIYKLDLQKLTFPSEPVLPSYHMGKKCNLGVNGVQANPAFNVLVSISWDKSLQFIDLRKTDRCTMKTLSKKPFAMDMNDKHLAVCTANNQVQIFDFRMMGVPLVETKESGLRYQTREVKINKYLVKQLSNDHIFQAESSLKSIANYEEDEFFVQSSYESRIIVDYLETPEKAQEKKFAFKCHKITSSDNVEMISPINSIVLFKEKRKMTYQENLHDLLYTAGSDGLINLWDLNKKKKLKKLKKFPQSVIKLAISSPNSAIPKLTNSTEAEYLLAIVTADDSFKNNRYLDGGVGSADAGMNNTHHFNTKLYLKFI